MDQMLSIITNFGCHYTCPYCIVKNCGIKVPKTTPGSLLELPKIIKELCPSGISVSGGGDPLHGYDDNAYIQLYYDHLMRICEERGLPFEMHTSYIKSGFPYERCHRVVYHIRSLTDLFNIHRRDGEIVRVVYVVTKEFMPGLIDLIADFVEASTDIDELSFRQMVDENYQATTYCQEHLRAGHKKRWWYIEQDDYNTYFAEGKIYHKYSDIGKEK